MQSIKCVLLLATTALVGSCGSCIYDLSGTRCGGANGECGTGYTCSAEGTCQKAAPSGDAAVAADSGSAPLDSGSVALDSGGILQDAGEPDAAAPPGPRDAGCECLPVDAGCTTGEECATKVCVQHQCKSAFFIDDFEQEPPAPDGGSFGNWTVEEDCRQWPECAGARAEVTTESAYVHQGAHGARFTTATPADAGVSPYWAFVAKDIGVGHTSIVASVWMRWVSGRPATGCEVYLVCLGTDVPDPGNRPTGLLLDLETIGAGADLHWHASPYNGVQSVASSDVPVDDVWHLVEMHYGQSGYSVLLDGASIGSGTKSAGGDVRWVGIGDMGGCGAYSLAFDSFTVNDEP